MEKIRSKARGPAGCEYVGCVISWTVMKMVCCRKTWMNWNTMKTGLHMAVEI